MKHQIINLFLDTNVWDFFFSHQMDLLNELPEDKFNLLVTPEVEIEIRHMPEDKREYVNTILKSNRIGTDLYFGFADDPRAGGFGELHDPSTGGRFITVAEQDFITNEKPKDSIRPTGLRKGEADTYLAARSLHYVVLTCDIKSSIKRAKENHEGAIVDLKKYNHKNSLSEFIKNELKHEKKR